ncbi:cysteine desulfurase family protein [Bacillus sp. FJAT-47783]|uniref:cysteine desulfurase family protein n=1 Tax=Bacillus sp. FJAT-47783 TaxID=2922712 RepID=UPI001FABE19C|nr:cysteine desulfurase family protein [Bacillus sp. FJAT-47783]
MLYLDNSATTKPYPQVIDTYRQVSESFFGNPSSIHKLGIQAEQLLTKARKQVASLLHIQEREVIFTSGATEGNNLALKGAAFALKEKGNHIITTTIEHPSVSEATKQLKEQFGFDITYVPVDENGFVTVEQIEKEIRDDTIIVSCMHVNNEIGTIQPINEIGNMLKKYRNIVFHVDHVQGVCKVPLNIREANIHLCTISGHKFHALNGTGVLFIRDKTPLVPLFSGGSQENTLRPGTESLAGAVSLAKGLRLALQQYEQNKQKLFEVKKYLLKLLDQMDDVVINTPKHHSAPHIINFSIPGIKAEVLVHMLEEHDIYVSTTSACSSKLKSTSKTLLAMGRSQAVAESSIRVSLSYEHTKEDMEKFSIVLTDSIQKLKKIMGL